MSIIIKGSGRGTLRSWVYARWLRAIHIQLKNGCLSCWRVFWQSIAMILWGSFSNILGCSIHWIGFSRSQFRTQWENAQVTLRERIKTPGMRTRSASTKNNLLRSRLCCLVPPTVCCYFNMICVLSVTWTIDAWILANDRVWNRLDYKHEYTLDFVITVTLNRHC